MRIKAKQEKLAKALSNVSKVAATNKASLPILSNVLIRVDDGVVTFTTTNLDMAIVDKLNVAECENGVVTVPAKFFAEFISNLPKNEDIEIRTDGDKVITEAGEYSSVINGAAADEFPELPGIDEAKMVKFSISVEDFKLGMTQVMIATGNDMTRPALTGMYFNTRDNALYAVATDGYRLSERKLLDKIDDEVMAIVPAASIRSILGLLDESAETVEILFDESQVRFRVHGTELTSKLLDGSFPDYRQLIPKTCLTNVKVKKEELSRVVKLAALFAKEVGGSIVCRTDAEKGRFAVASVANELGENNSDMKAEVDNTGKVTLNSRYLLDYLNVISDKDITFSFSNPLDPVMVQGEKPELVHIIMPLKGCDDN